MAGLIFVSPGEFTDPSDLPQVPPTPVMPIRGAMIDWAADRLPTGALPAWTDMLGARTLEAPANPPQYPAVSGGGITRRVTFDGTNDRMLATMGLSQPLTMVVVARSTTGDPSEFLLTGWNTQSWNLGINGGGRWTFFNGGTIIGPNADTNWHVFIVNVNGANSVLSVDGDETTGTADNATWEDVAVGSSASAYYGVELRRLAVIPRATTAPEREALRQQLATHYSI